MVHISIPTVSGTLLLPYTKFALLLVIATNFKGIMKKVFKPSGSYLHTTLPFLSANTLLDIKTYLNSSDLYKIQKPRLFWLSNIDYLRLQESKDKR